MNGDLIIAIVTALLTGAAGYMLAVKNASIDLDEATRKARVDEYKKLWTLTGKLPQYPPAEDLKYKDLKSLSENMRDWYFHDGGIFLSDKSRDLYFEVQKTLQHYSKINKDLLSPYNPKGEYDTKSDYEAIRLKMSALRTQLTRDISSRRMPGWTQDNEDSRFQSK